MRQVVIYWTGGTPGYGDARVDGRVVISRPGVDVFTNTGPIPLPLGRSALHPRVPHVGDHLACALSFGGPDRAAEWVLTTEGWEWKDRGPSCGTSPVIYDLAGVLHISQCQPPVGSQGWRFVDETTGRLVTCDETNADPVKGIWNYTPWPDVWIGQGGNGIGEGAVVWFPDLGLRRLTFEEMRDRGQLRDIRADRDGDDFAITVVDYDQHLTTVTWGTLAELRAMPAIEVPPPPTTEPDPAVAAWPRKIWIAPYFSHSERYGDTPLDQHVGNAVCVVPDEQNPEASIARELDRIRPLGLPMIVASGDYDIPTVNDNQTVAWLASSATAAALGTSVTRAFERADKPVIAYLDSGIPSAWPTMRPAWMTERVWPSPQVYRGPSESIAAFVSRLTTLLDRVAAYGLPLVLTCRFDDFNGSSTVERTLACMTLYEQWARDYRVVGLMPFSDRRGNGIAKDARLKAWASAFLQANPARPNRFDYWTPTGADMTAVLKNKLGQTTELIALSAGEKDYLLERL